jgi:hypothetical protein
VDESASNSLPFCNEHDRKIFQHLHAPQCSCVPVGVDEASHTL